MEIVHTAYLFPTEYTSNFALYAAFCRLDYKKTSIVLQSSASESQSFSNM